MPDDQGPTRSLLTTVTLVSGAFTVYLLNELLNRLYTPDVEAFRQRAATLVTPFALPVTIPEPMEQTQLLVLLPATFVVMFVFWSGLRVAFSSTCISGRSVRYLVQVPSWLVGILILTSFFVTCRQNGFFYQQSSLLVQRPRLFCFGIFPLLLIAYHRVGKRAWQLVFKLWRPLFVLLLAGAELGCTLFSNGILPYEYHFNPVVYPLALVSVRQSAW